MWFTGCTKFTVSMRRVKWEMIFIKDFNLFRFILRQYLRQQKITAEIIYIYCIGKSAWMRFAFIPLNWTIYAITFGKIVRLHFSIECGGGGVIRDANISIRTSIHSPWSSRDCLWNRLLVYIRSRPNHYSRHLPTPWTHIWNSLRQRHSVRCDRGSAQPKLKCIRILLV